MQQNTLKGVNYKICCFHFDKSNKKLISGFNPYFTPDIESALEVMNQTFFIRKDSGALLLEVPTLIRYQLKGDAISFDIVE